MKRTIFGLVFLELVVVWRAAAGEVYIFDFEDGKVPATARLENAEITSENSEVISGRYSLKADTFDLNREWNEFFHTNPAKFRFKKDHIYHIKFKYRSSRVGNNTFYFLMRSEQHTGTGGCFDISPPWITGLEEGKVYERGDIFTIQGADDYYLIIGIKDKGVLVIDDIIIEDLGSISANSFLVEPIKNVNKLLVEAGYNWLKEYENEYKVYARMANVNLVVSAYYTLQGEQNEDVRERVVSELQPDYISWGHFNHSWCSLGIRTAVQGMEYDGFYYVERSFYPELGYEYWDKRFEVLGDGGGFLVRLDGNFVQDFYWGGGLGSYLTCHNGDNWKRLQMLSMIRRLDYFEDIAQDNIGKASFIHGGCYCKACKRKFQEYLAERYTSEELKQNWQIEDVKKLDMQEYIKKGNFYGMFSLKNSLLREWIKFHHLQHLKVWVDNVINIKKRGLELGRDVAVFGNQDGLIEINTSTNLIPYVDAIELECYGAPYHFLTARGLSCDKKNYWTRATYGNYDPRYMQWDEIPWEFLANRTALSLTYGGSAIFWCWWNSQDNLEKSDAYKFYKNYSKYIHSHRAAYGYRRVLTDIAVVFSLPTAMWQNFPPFGLGVNAPTGEYRRCIELFTDNSIPIDVVGFGHPEFWDEEPHLERMLKRFKILILPNVRCLTSKQRAALKQFLEQGGKIFYTGELGTRDENFNNTTPFTCTSGNLIKLEKIDQTVVDNLKKFSYLEINTPKVYLEKFSPSSKYHRKIKKSPVKGIAYIHSHVPTITIHLWNDGCPYTPGVTIPAGPVSVLVKIPHGFTYDTVYSASFDHPEEDIPLKHITQGNRINIYLPKIRNYEVIVIGKREAIQQEERRIQSLLVEDRERVKSFCPNMKKL